MTKEAVQVTQLEKFIVQQMRRGYHCSQIMMQLTLMLRGRDEPFVLRAMGALGAGMFARRTCGTLTGAVCALSSYFPRGEGAPEPDGYQALVGELVEWFEGEYQSLDCRDLVRPEMDHILEICPSLMERTFHKMMELLDTYEIDPNV